MSKIIPADQSQPPDTTSLDPEKLQAMLQDLEAEVGAPKDSLSTLPLENDWSMIIKGHALIEGSVSLLLAAALDPRLKTVFARLELGREDTGKLEFTKALDLLSTGKRKFIRLVSKLRNLCAHDPSYLAFTVADYVKALDKQQLESFEDALMFDVTGEPATANWRKFIGSNPALALAVGMMRVIIHAISQALIIRKDKELDKLHLDYAKAIQELEEDGKA